MFPGWSCWSFALRSRFRPTPKSCRAWANAAVAKGVQNDEVLWFVEAWKQRTRQLPAKLVFDSRLTTYANLARLDATGIAFRTLRRPGPRPRPPTLLITNQLDMPPRKLIDRYARRMVIEDTIADAIDFLHTDALSAMVPMKIDVDVRLTVMASTLYRILAKRIGHRCETQKPAKLFRKFVNAGATVEITEHEIVVSLGRRAYNSFLTGAGLFDTAERLPWLGERTLRLPAI